MKSMVTTYSRLKSTYPYVALLIIFSVCFVPYIPVASKLSIRFEDLLLPFVTIALVPVWREFKKLYFLVLFGWCVWGVFTMAVNDGLEKVNDYFELYKLLKYMIYTVLFMEFFKLKKAFFNFAVALFLALVLFNSFHYFNLFDFNKLVMPAYCPNKLQLQYFGRNSLGGVATKRILGTMGNPNINGILFLFFNSYFLSLYDKYKWHLSNLLFFLSFAMLLFTQSRTSLIAFVVYFVVFIILQKMNWRSIARIVVGLFICGLGVQYADQLSLHYFSDASFDPEFNGSMRGRLETWKFLWEMIVQKPFFGYGIDKNFFYENEIYSENEYLLNIWRYGFPGLIFYLVMVVGLLFSVKLKRHNCSTLPYRIWFILVIIVVLVSALTNNVLANPMLLIAFAVTAGAFMSTVERNEAGINPYSA